MTKPKISSKKAARAKTGRKGAKSASGSSTKLGQLETMLRRPEGATIPQLVKALDWQAHSVRGAMSGSLKKKQGLKITAAKADGEDRVYWIAE